MKKHPTWRESRKNERTTGSDTCLLHFWTCFTYYRCSMVFLSTGAPGPTTNKPTKLADGKTPEALQIRLPKNMFNCSIFEKIAFFLWNKSICYTLLHCVIACVCAYRHTYMISRFDPSLSLLYSFSDIFSCTATAIGCLCQGALSGPHRASGKAPCSKHCKHRSRENDFQEKVPKKTSSIFAKEEGRNTAH